MQLQVWGQLGWTGRPCMHVLGQVMVRLRYMRRQWGSGWISAVGLHVGWELWWITGWVAHVRLNLDWLCALALVSMHVGILASEEPMPHVPNMPVLPRHGLHGLVLAT